MQITEDTNLHDQWNYLIKHCLFLYNHRHRITNWYKCLHWSAHNRTQVLKLGMAIMKGLLKINHVIKIIKHFCEKWLLDGSTESNNVNI